MNQLEKFIEYPKLKEVVIRLLIVLYIRVTSIGPIIDSYPAVKFNPPIVRFGCSGAFILDPIMSYYKKDGPAPRENFVEKLIRFPLLPINALEIMIPLGRKQGNKI